MPAAKTRRVRRLTDDEIDAYNLVPPDIAARTRLVRVPKVGGPFHGITLGRYVMITRDVPPGQYSRLVAHELVHVRQWSELGVVGFLAGYLPGFARALKAQRNWDAAYRQIPAEAEAYDLAGKWARRRKGGPANRPKSPETQDQQSSTSE